MNIIVSPSFSELIWTCSKHRNKRVEIACENGLANDLGCFQTSEIDRVPHKIALTYQITAPHLHRFLILPQQEVNLDSKSLELSKKD